MRITIDKIVKSVTPYVVLWYLKKIEQKKHGVRSLEFTLFGDNSPNYYGQCGEDILLRLFCEKDKNYKGFYIDIGAYHPTNLSNTKYFYNNGWSGINIDANPSSIEVFNKVRERDINIESGVSDESGKLEYYYFGESDSINTFNKKQAAQFEKIFGRKVKEIKKVKVQTITDIFKKYLPAGQHIDFITLDVEGFEMKILKSFDFNKYAPDYFLVEDLAFAEKSFSKLKASPVYKLLNENGYIPIGKADISVLYKKI